MLEKLFRKVRDAKNNERHVCGRAQVGERPVSWSRRNPFSPAYSELPGRSALPLRYVEALSDARTTLEGFCSVLTYNWMTALRGRWSEARLERVVL